MFLDFRKTETATQHEADICIIGTGPAGISIARSLEATGARIVVLESGGYESDPDTQALYQGESVGFQHTDLDTCRLRYLGGSSNCWNGWCSPLDPIDFEQRDWVEYSGWPINYDELLPYYEHAQLDCEVGPFGYDEGLWGEIDLSRQPFDSRRIRTPFWQYSPPTRFGQRYRYALANSESMTTLLHASALEIDLQENGNRVDGVRIASLNGRTGYVRANRVVVACGGIENPRLLLASNSRQSAGLGNENDMVGRFFMEHPYAISGFALTRETDHLPTVEKWLNNVRYEAVYCTGFEAQREHQVLNSMALTWLEEDSNHLFGWGRGTLPTPEEGFLTHTLMTQSEQAPNPASRISLSSQVDAFNKPLAKMDWQLLAADKKAVRTQMELLGAELARLNLGRLKLADWLLDGDAMWGMGGGNHHMGTTRMGDDPNTSVVDANCRVHGIRNLYVAGSSVFPTGGWANPTLTLVALALRLADHLKSEIEI